MTPTEPTPSTEPTPLAAANATHPSAPTEPTPKPAPEPAPETPSYTLLELIRDTSADPEPEHDTPAARFLSVPPRSVWPD